MLVLGMLAIALLAIAGKNRGETIPPDSLAKRPDQNLATTGTETSLAKLATTAVNVVKFAQKHLGNISGSELFGTVIAVLPYVAVVILAVVFVAAVLYAIWPNLFFDENENHQTKAKQEYDKLLNQIKDKVWTEVLAKEQLSGDDALHYATAFADGFCFQINRLRFNFYQTNRAFSDWAYRAGKFYGAGVEPSQRSGDVYPNPPEIVPYPPRFAEWHNIPPDGDRLEGTVLMRSGFLTLPHKVITSKRFSPAFDAGMAMADISGYSEFMREYHSGFPLGEFKYDIARDRYRFIPSGFEYDVAKIAAIGINRGCFHGDLIGGDSLERNVAGRTVRVNWRQIGNKKAVA